MFQIVSTPLTYLEKKYHARYKFLFTKPSGSELKIITELVETGEIYPIVDRVYPFEETQQTLEYSETGRVKEKIVLKMD